MKKLTCGLYLLCSVFLSGCETTSSPDLPTVSIGEQTFYVEIADTPALQRTGLMAREYLPHNQGMLFVFDRERIYPFWMKDTYIPLDMVWISAEKKVVYIEHAIPCLKVHCPSYVPDEYAQYVLEVNKGLFKGKIGDEAIFNLSIDKTPVPSE